MTPGEAEVEIVKLVEAYGVVRANPDLTQAEKQVIFDRLDAEITALKVFRGVRVIQGTLKGG